MNSLKYIFVGFLLLYAGTFLVILNLSSQPSNCPMAINSDTAFLQGDQIEEFNAPLEVLNDSTITIISDNTTTKAEPSTPSKKKSPAKVVKWDYKDYKLELGPITPEMLSDEKIDPFYYLGAFDLPEYEANRLNKTIYGLEPDPNYCRKVDLFNLANPENVFEKMNFFTDHWKGGLYRKQVMKAIGNDMMPSISLGMTKEAKNTRQYKLRHEITSFHMLAFNLHRYHKIGVNFLCPTQMYNHIPGHEYLAYKDRVTDSAIEYSLKYKDKPQCFNRNMFFPSTFRLHHEDECKEFFTTINSQSYKESLKKEPIQFIIKIGHGVHASLGVFLLDPQEEKKLKDQYGPNGENCGKVNKSLLAQHYVGNPLLVNVDKKIDFRAYLLVTSIDPLIAYYHEGVIRVSLRKYDKFSTDRGTHITNTHLTDAEVAKLKKEGKTQKEIDAIYFNCEAWMFHQLQTHLLETGKIVDPNWLENHFRPSIKKVMLHMLRMSEKHLSKFSNVYELYALDLMIDDNFNVWFIECNTNPQLTGSTKDKEVLFLSMLKGMFEIQYAHLRSRVKRYMILLHEMYEQAEDGELAKSEIWHEKFINASKNRLEPEFKISPKNSWVPFIDRNLKGKDAYYGLLPEECIDDVDL